MGPFYPVIKPLERDADLTVIKGKRGRAQGQVIELMGRVVNRRGEPVRGARLELGPLQQWLEYSHVFFVVAACALLVVVLLQLVDVERHKQRVNVLDAVEASRDTVPVLS